MNINVMGLLTIFVTGVTYITVVIWILNKRKWGLKVDGFGPLVFMGLLYGVLLTGFSFFYELLELPVGLTFLVIFLVFPVISFLISVQVLKGVRIKDTISVVIAVISIIVLNL
jgi:hypothetical protein